MDELISRQKVLEYLSRLIVNVGRCNGKGVFTRMLSDYVEYVKNLPTEKKASEWIPCSERMPEQDGTYIVSGVWENGERDTGECDFQVEDGYFDAVWVFNVEAWMPKLKPYGEEKK